MANPLQTYEYIPGSGESKDKLRLIIPDRPDKARNPPAAFSDEELKDLLASDFTLGNILEAASMACQIIGMNETKRAISVNINSGMSISRINRSQFWLQRAEFLHKWANTDPFEIAESAEYLVDALGNDVTHYDDHK